jgi:4-diphosphocytidyl-2-C-methyl-D-erythritol kinase
VTSPGTPPPASLGPTSRWQLPRTLWAPAKLTLSLRVTGVRPDGYHLLEAEMVTIDLADVLELEAGSGVAVVDEVVGELGLGVLAGTRPNLVERALDLSGRRAAVRLRKRIPVGAGLGGGSADAGAILRWAGRLDPGLALRLGGDVPFCVSGGRAVVTGVGEVIESRPFESRSFALVLPPFGVDTAAVYRAYDEAGTADSRTAALTPPSGVDRGGRAWVDAVSDGGNDLEAAALSVAPDLVRWRDALGNVTGRRPRLAGSGSTWFVEGSLDDLNLADRPYLVVRGWRAPVVAVRSVPEGWEGPG